MNRAVRRRPLVLTLAVLAATALAGCTSTAGAGPGRPQASTAPDDPATRPELKAFYGQKLKWTPCGDLQCARLTVPMDYGRPGTGKTFVLPVAKAATADPAERIGSLVYNPGGPGASGISDLKSGTAETFSAALRERFDVVSFDPRGVGASRPALHCAEDEAQDEGDAGGGQPLYPRSEDDRASALAGARLTAAACKKGSGAILPHVGTRDAARDLDVLRAAVGDSKLTYVGWSYGTSLGTTYAEQFPRRVRALVLDGAIDPSLDWSQRAVGQAAGFERAVDDYATYCADVAGDSCPGETSEEIHQLIDRLYGRAGREPLPIDGDEYGLDARGVLDAVSMAMYTPEAQWEDLSAALREADDGDGTRLAGLDAADDVETGSEDADDPAAPESADPSESADAGEPPADNEDSALLAVNCLDTPHPRSAEPYWDALAGAEKAAGVYGPSSVIDALSCKDWPAGEQRPHRVRAEGVPPVLVVGTTGDPATPYEESESLAAQLPGGMLLTYEGLGHTAYGRSNACVTDAVDGYLIARKPVRSGTTC
ncbi:MAG TPA: alpha/beta hydrolase [Streptomyces sp.]|nr:alpha/beta hydrolase [Streptomyces sp.]